MQNESAGDPPPAIIFGKGHASRFEPADAHLAERAAGLMGMRVLRPSTPEDLALAAELPKARVFRSGKAFCPAISRSRFERLAASPAAFAPEPPPAGSALSTSGKPSSGDPAQASADAPITTLMPGGGPDAPPNEWSALSEGSLVLAADDDNPHAWYVAILKGERGEALVELQWFHWPDEPLVVRRREHLGLFPVALAGTLA